MSNNVFTSEIAESRYEDGIMHFRMIDPNPSLAAYKQHFYASRDFFGKEIMPSPAIVFSANGKTSYSKEVRDFMATAEFAEITAAVAIITDSMIMRVAANLFLKLTRLPYPTQLFTDKDKALTWLQPYKKKQ